MNNEEFGKYIKKLREEAKLTLRKLQDLTGVSNAYLSQIENAKKTKLPSPEILMKIHGPLGVSYDELMEKAGYISHKTRSELIPETIETMESYSDLLELISNAADIFISSIKDGETGKLQEEFKNIIFEEAEMNGISENEINELMNEPDIKRQVFEHLTLEEKVSFLNGIIKDLTERGINLKEAFKPNDQKIEDNTIPLLRVPVLGHIAAGQPILAEEHIEDWMDIPNMWSLKPGSAIVLRVKGDSMIGSRIYDGDKVVVKLQPEVENGEIAVVNIDGDQATLKKVKKTANGQVILYPDNPMYEPIFISDQNARVIGKVIQVMFEPK